MIKLAGGVSSHDQMGLENENFIRTQVKLSSEISTLYKSVITCSPLNRVIVGRISALVNKGKLEGGKILTLKKEVA